jgi:xanthine/uracil/vitamin C permease (AzgA family)
MKYRTKIKHKQIKQLFVSLFCLVYIFFSFCTEQGSRAGAASFFLCDFVLNFLMRLRLRLYYTAKLFYMQYDKKVNTFEENT